MLTITSVDLHELEFPFLGTLSAVWFHYVQSKADNSTAGTSRTQQLAPKQPGWMKSTAGKRKKCVFYYFFIFRVEVSINFGLNMEIKSVAY